MLLLKQTVQQQRTAHLRRIEQDLPQWIAATSRSRLVWGGLMRCFLFAEEFAGYKSFGYSQFAAERNTGRLSPPQKKELLLPLPNTPFKCLLLPVEFR
jgi:hypothetical protein